MRKEEKKNELFFFYFTKLIVFCLVWYNAQGHAYCEWVLNHVHECPCLTKDDEGRRVMDEISTQYSYKLIEIARYWDSLGLKEFKVSAQTYTQRMVFPLSFVSKLDCFVSWKKTTKFITFFYTKIASKSSSK